MKNDKLINTIMHYRTLLGQSERNMFDAALQEYQKQSFDIEAVSGGSAANFLALILGAAQSEMLTEKAKTTGKAATKKAIEKLFKLSLHDELKKAYIIDGRQYACDGYRIFILDEPIEFDECFTGTELNNMMNRVKTIFETSRSRAGEQVKVPSINELKLTIANQKAVHKANKSKLKYPYYDFGEGLPAVNAEFLMSVLTVYGEDVEIYASLDGVLSALYFKSSVGEGLLFPVNKKHLNG